MDHGCLLRMRLSRDRSSDLLLQLLQGPGQAAVDLEVDLQLPNQTASQKVEDRHPQGQFAAQKPRETPTASSIKDLMGMAITTYQ